MTILKLKTYSIYRIVSPSNRVYIGQTNNLKRRLNDYKKLKNCEGQKLLYKSFLKYGIKNHKIEVLFDNVFNVDNIDEKEIELIRIYKDLGISLNIRDGGNKIVNHLEKPVAQFDIEGNFLQKFKSMSYAAYCLNGSPSNISLAITSSKGYSLGYLWLFYDDYERGIKPVWKNKGKSKFRIPVNKFDLSGNFICTYPNIVEAAKDSNVSDTEIHTNLNNITGRAGDFIFSRENFVSPYKNKKIKKFYQFDKKGNLIQEWESVKSCIETLNITECTVRSSLNNNCLAANKYIFSYNSKCNPYSGPNGKEIYQYDSSGNLLNTFDTIEDARNKLDLCTATIRSKLRSKSKKYLCPKVKYTLSYGEYKEDIKDYKRPSRVKK